MTFCPPGSEVKNSFRLEVSGDCGVKEGVREGAEVKEGPEVRVGLDTLALENRAEGSPVEPGG